MTAEILIMNKNGIALAADSAVTSGGGKIYNSANKLFSLSRKYPVGIMIYGNASFMGIPWEIIIQEYRKKVGHQSFPTLKEYADHFIHFLKTHEEFHPKEYDKILVKRKIYYLLPYIFEKANEFIGQKYTDSIPSKEQKINELQKSLIFFINILGDFDNLKCFSDLKKEKLIDKYFNDICEIASDQADDDLPNELVDLFSDLAFLLISKDTFDSDFDFDGSGIVVAGYGENEIFPSFYSYNIDGIYNDVLRINLESNRAVDVMVTDLTTTAMIKPFAQQEMVHAFVEGADPELLNNIMNSIDDAFEQFPSLLAHSIGRELEQDIYESIIKIGNELTQDFKSKTKEFLQKEYIDPLLEVATILPKDELASMAKALVNLTSLKRKVSNQQETVGGPIDVAFISKGEGLIWIERKHYFKPDKNYQYLNNVRSETIGPKNS